MIKLFKVLPNELLKEINDFAFYSKLDMEYFLFLHKEKSGKYLYQIDFCKSMYEVEVYNFSDGTEIFVKDVLTFPDYILDEVYRGELDWETGSFSYSSFSDSDESILHF